MKKSIIAISLAFMISSSAHSQTAMAVASEMYPAWNLGNTLEAGPCSWLDNKLDYEIGWQSSRTTQQIIDYVKELGFRAVRIPCSWYIHMDDNYNIDVKWMDRVQQVVDYCIKDGLYVLLNDHHDGNWVEGSFVGLTETDIKKNCFIMGMMWKQIANRFRNYDNHLLFAGMNEPNAVTDKSEDKAKDVEILLRYEQAFVNAVRQTGGNNKTRILVTQAPCTNINSAYEYDILPSDPTPNAMMVEVHFYAPYNFVMMEKDESWGYRAFYWGECNHVEGSNHNSTDEEAYVIEQMRLMKKKYTSQGIPVIMGEYSTTWRTMPQGESQEKHDASIYSWYNAVTKYAIRNGIIPFAWDTNSCQRPTCTIIDRKNLAILNKYAYNGIMDACESVKWPYTSIENVPYPSSSSTSELIYDLSGRRIDSIPQNGMYIYGGKKYFSH